MRPNHTAEAVATESITLKAGSFIAPANGGTIARTPGRKRLTNKPAKPDAKAGWPAIVGAVS